jgi:hypothetical protein
LQCDENEVEKKAILGSSLLCNYANNNYVLVCKELYQHEDKFYSYYRISKESFINLVQLVKYLIRGGGGGDTAYQKSVPVQERMLVT